MFSRFKSVAAALIIIAGIPASGRGAGVARQYLTDVWTADNGLPDSSVTAIVQTPDGYLWIGTYDGLARFDGVHFKTFDPGNTPALAHARVRQLAVDAQGTLWINTYDGSMTSMRHGIFTREWTGGDGIDPDATLVSSSSNQVTFLLHRGSFRRKTLPAPAGKGWEDLAPPSRVVGALSLTDGAGNLWYRNSDKHLLRLAGGRFEPVPASSGLPDQSVNCAVIDGRGRLWIGTSNAIAVWNDGRFQILTPTNGEPSQNVTFLSVTKDDHVWAVVNGRVLEGFNRRWLREVVPLRNLFTGNMSRLGAQPDNHGGIWLYDYERGLFHVDADGRSHHFDTGDNFPGDRVNCFFKDREGSWWAGLDDGGLVRIRERRFEVVATGGKISTQPAKSVCEGPDGTVWIGTLGDGLLCWSPTGTATNWVVPGGTDRGFAFSVCLDATGRTWVSAGAEDLYLLERGGFKRVTPVVHGVKSLLADPTGRLWVGTKSGLSFADADQPLKFKAYDGIPRSDIRALAEDGRGNLWAGADDGTLFRIKGAVVTAFHPTDVKRKEAIWSLLAETNGTVWAGTFRGGLLRFRDGRFTRFDKMDGLPDDVICQILDDGRGNLWLGSYRGITCIAKSVLEEFSERKIRALTCVTYGRADGLPSLECSSGYQPAAWRGRNGWLWFTTLKGVVSVEPQRIKLNRVPPPVVIEEVLVDGKPQEIGDDIHLLVVPPGKHLFEFHYTGNSLAAPDRVRFRYQLEGIDGGWINAGARRSSGEYNYLRPGKYVFHVTACNSDGIWNDTGASLTLKILPHFYETLWFQWLTGLAALAAVILAIRGIMLRRLRWRMEQLERQHAVERERARIARDIHDDLGASLNLIAVLGDLAKREKTDERIERMSVTARQAVKSLDEIVWAVNPRNDTLTHLIDYAGQHATSYLRAAGIRCLLDVPEQLPPFEVATNVRHNLFLVIKEALQNIVKHSCAGEVWLRVRLTAKTLQVVIDDNGCGFEPSAEDPWADGLRNMRERLAEIGGECRIQSRKGAGTCITVELPWPPG